jgi:hypothetical protein
MKNLSVILIVLSLCSCRNLISKHQDYLAIQNKGKFTVNINSPQFTAGESGAQFDSAIPFVPLKEVNVSILYFPVEDAACLQYRTDSYTFYQFWSKESRESFVNGLEDYNKDFDEQNLRRNFTGKTKWQYGTANGYLIWQMSRFTSKASGHIEYGLGYYFREKSPFFTVVQGNAKSENGAGGSEAKRNMSSGERPMYFTKAQASKVAECFDQQYLQSIVPESLRNLQPQRSDIPVVYDEY